MDAALQGDFGAVVISKLSDYAGSKGRNEGQGFYGGCEGVLDDDKFKEEAVWMLRQAFHANTSRLAQPRKRQDVEVFATNAAGSGTVYPYRIRQGWRGRMAVSPFGLKWLSGLKLFELYNAGACGGALWVFVKCFLATTSVNNVPLVDLVHLQRRGSESSAASASAWGCSSAVSRRDKVASMEVTRLQAIASLERGTARHWRRPNMLCSGPVDRRIADCTQHIERAKKRQGAEADVKKCVEAQGLRQEEFVVAEQRLTEFQKDTAQEVVEVNMVPADTEAVGPKSRSSKDVSSPRGLVRQRVEGGGIIPPNSDFGAYRALDLDGREALQP